MPTSYLPTGEERFDPKRPLRVQRYHYQKEEWLTVHTIHVGTSWEDGLISIARDLTEGVFDAEIPKEMDPSDVGTFGGIRVINLEDRVLLLIAPIGHHIEVAIDDPQPLPRMF